MAQVMSPHPLHPDTPRPRNLGEERPQKMGKGKEEGERAGASFPLCQGGRCLPIPPSCSREISEDIPVLPNIILIFPRNIPNFSLSPEGLSDLKEGGPRCPSTLGVLPRLIPKFPQDYPNFFPGLSQFSPGFPKFPW